MKKYRCLLLFICLLSSFMFYGCSHFGIVSKDIKYSFQPLNKVEKIKLKINKKESNRKISFKSELLNGSNVKVSVNNDKDKTISSIDITKTNQNGELDLAKVNSDNFTINIEGKADKFILNLDSSNISLAAESPDSKQDAKDADSKEKGQPSNPKDKNGGFHLWPFF